MAATSSFAATANRCSRSAFPLAAATGLLAVLLRRVLQRGITGPLAVLLRIVPPTAAEAVLLRGLAPAATEAVLLRGVPPVATEAVLLGGVPPAAAEGLLAVTGLRAYP